MVNAATVTYKQRWSGTIFKSWIKLQMHVTGMEVADQRVAAGEVLGLSGALPNIWSDPSVTWSCYSELCVDGLSKS